MGLAELSNVLWRQRQLLDLLLFRMTVEERVLMGGNTRWLARATDEVEAVLDEMRETELVRTLVVDHVAQDLGLEPSPSLDQLADAAPEPWQGVLREHRRAFLALTAEVQTVAEANRARLGREQRATERLLDHLTGDCRPTTAS